MRRILVEVARKKQSQKRGGNLNRVTIVLESVSDMEGGIAGEQLLLLDASLNELAQHHKIAAMLVNMRFFAGMTMEESSVALGISKRTAQRDWAFAKAWLHEALKDV
jgi:RNA polymerase sigma factor (TIGR02999 family)